MWVIFDSSSVHKMLPLRLVAALADSFLIGLGERMLSGW